jgi:hypothetical protein
VQGGKPPFGGRWQADRGSRLERAAAAKIGGPTGGWRDGIGYLPSLTQNARNLTNCILLAFTR